MAVAFIQSTTGGTTSAGTSVSTSNFGTSPVTGNFITVGIFEAGGTNNIQSVTDSGGNTYTLAAKSNNGTNCTTSVYYAYNITGGANFKITVNYTVNGENIGVTAREYSGVNTASNPLDQTATSAGLSIGPTATSTQSNEVVVATISTNANTAFTVGTGYSNFIDNGLGSGHLGVEDQIVDSIQGYTATFNGGGAFTAGVMATFKGIPLNTTTSTSLSTSSTSVSSTSTSISSTSSSLSTSSTSTSTTTLFNPGFIPRATIRQWGWK